MPRKGENIYKRRDGRWEGRFIKSHNDFGKAIYGYVYAKSYTAVKQKMCDAIRNLPQKIPQENNPQICFNLLFDQWLAQKKPQIRESTYAQYCRIIEKHLRPAWGLKSVSSISATQYQMFIEGLLCSGRLDGAGGLSTKAVKDISVLFKSILSYAQAIGISSSRSVLIYPIKKASQKPLKILSVEEQHKLISYLTTDLDNDKLCVLLVLFWGLRIGEICALKWKDIDFSKGVVHIRRTLQRINNTECNGTNKTKIIITSPKSECSVRDIPIADFVANILYSFDMSPEAFIATGFENSFIEPRTMQNRFKRMLIASHVDPINFHALRHTFATRCIECGFDAKSLSEILGHATVAITLNKYVHPSYTTKKQHMEKLFSLI